MQTSFDNLDLVKVQSEARKRKFIRDKMYFCLNKTELEALCIEKGFKEDDLIEIPDTNGYIHKNHKKEFLKVFKTGDKK